MIHNLMLASVWGQHHDFEPTFQGTQAGMNLILEFELKKYSPTSAPRPSQHLYTHQTKEYQ